jgi:hypothetical protein
MAKQTAGTQVAAPSQVGNPAAIYRALRDQRDVLGDQLQDLQEQRSDLVAELANASTPSVLKPGLERRLSQIDARIADLDQQIAKADQAVAQAAGVPGATVQPPRPPQTVPDPDVVATLTFVVVLVFAIPISIAYARRIWRRSARADAMVVPPQLTERMEMIERGVDAIALEVERIGEGQRFLTQTMGERVPARAVGAGDDRVPVRAGDRPEERR